MDYSIDCIVELVNRYLENDQRPTASKVNIDGYEYVAYTINGYPFIIDPLELVFKSMEIFENDQEWNKR